MGVIIRNISRLKWCNYTQKYYIYNGVIISKHYIKDGVIIRKKIASKMGVIIRKTLYIK